MRSPDRTIAIVGAGFSGTVLAANLLQRAGGGQPLRIVLIEVREECGRGVAYQRGNFAHLLNVPAVRMSAGSADPLQFARYAQARDPRCDAQQFLPRSLYGDYLQEVLRQAVAAAPAHIRLERLHVRADSIHRINHTGPYLVSLSNAQRILADDVVLACGNPPASSPSAAVGITGHPAYLCDPYDGPALRRDAQTVLLIGAGLTMADVAVATVALNPRVQIHAISRHGLLPSDQTQAGSLTVPEGLQARLAPGQVTTRNVLRAFRSLLLAVQGQGGDWRDAINVARHDVPAVWAELAPSERARFLRHLRARWDVHRHRMPPAIHAQLLQLSQAGRFQLEAGNLLPLTAQGDRIEARWRVRGTDLTRRLVVDAVINCAGADGRLKDTRDPLLSSLMSDGLAQPDGAGLGLQTDDNGALIGQDGQPASHLFYVGPMLRARHWEATAVGELRGHVERLARLLTPAVQAA